MKITKTSKTIGIDKTPVYVLNIIEDSQLNLIIISNESISGFKTANEDVKLALWNVRDINSLFNLIDGEVAMMCFNLHLELCKTYSSKIDYDVKIEETEGEFNCICGNNSFDSGFFPCDESGYIIEPLKEIWKDLYVCMKCDAIIDQNTLKITGFRENYEIINEKLEKLWSELKEIHMDEAGYIEKPFHIWEEGTDIRDIEHWFDQNHTKGIQWLEENYENMKA